MTPRKRRTWWPWALGALIVIVVVVVLVVVFTGSSAPSNTATTSGAPTTDQLRALLPTRADVPADWSVGTAPHRPAGPDTSTSVDCTTGYDRLYAAPSSSRPAAHAAFSAVAPPPAVVTAPPTPSHPSSSAPTRTERHSSTPVRPTPPPPPPAVPARLDVSVASYPIAQAQAQYRTFIETLVHCPAFTTADGTSATVGEGTDTNSLGNQSDQFRIDYADGRTAAHHAIVWESRSDGTLWRLVYTYPGDYNRDQTRQLIGRAVAKWKAGQ